MLVLPGRREHAYDIVHYMWHKYVNIIRKECAMWGERESALNAWRILITADRFMCLSVCVSVLKQLRFSLFSAR